MAALAYLSWAMSKAGSGAPPRCSEGAQSGLFLSYRSLADYYDSVNYASQWFKAIYYGIPT